MAEIESELSLIAKDNLYDEGRWNELNHFKLFINSLPEEHPYKTGDKVWYLNELYTLEDDGKHYILTAVRDKVTVSVVHLDYGDEDYKLLPYEEPVSEDLEEASRRYALNNTPCDDCADEMQEAFKAGAQWQKENLWKPADGEDLPEIDREVVVLTQPYSNDEHLRVVFAHRPNPEGWDAKSIITEKVERYIPETYDKGGWNIPDVKWWLDVELPKEIEL